MEANTTRISTRIERNKVKVVSTYNPNFVQKARNLRGVFDDGAWWFDEEVLEYVTDAVRKVYGVTGLEEYEECELLIKEYSDCEYGAPCELFGRMIARAFGRDSGAKLGDDIALLSGKIKSGGSMKNWTTEIEDATFIIKNFPLPATEAVAIKEAIEAGWCEVKRRAPKRSESDILGEIERHKAAIDALERELSTTKTQL